MNHPWIEHYPAGVPAELPPYPYRSLAEFLSEAFAKHGDKPAFKFMGRTLTYRELDEASTAFAAYLQSTGLKPGDRVALMMPNVLQYPIAIAGVMRAGMVAVNTNPLYTPRELEHQLKDSGAKAIVVLENMAATLEACRQSVPVEHVIVATIGETLSPLKGMLVNFVVRRVKKMVPAYSLPGSITWTEAMKRGAKARYTPAGGDIDDVAVLQYTGGTTGPSKGATLTHRNVIANVLQSELWFQPALKRVKGGDQPHTVCALPLYHIFGFTVNMMLAMRTGGCNILITNPRDIPAVLKELKKHKFHLFPAVNTLFGAIARHPDARQVDWSNLIVSMGGGMAVQPATAKQWLELTGCPICEGYGLSETSPVASANDITSKTYTGTIGLPFPSTVMRIIDEDDRELPVGERGEIAIKGPQVFQGYWNRPDETSRAFTSDGFFKSGDIGVMDERGAFKIVDRKKDMIIVSGFNVYPNEIEEVVTQMPGVTEAAAVGVPDETSGEAVKLFVVRSDPALTEDAVKTYCRENLTGYKRPRSVEFLNELPKTNVGKILRRALRD